MKKKIVPNSSTKFDERNTNQISCAKYWCFTLNNWTENEYNMILEQCNSSKFQYSIGKEICPTTGTPHLQGFIKFKEKIRPKSVFNWTERISWRACTGSERSNLNYTQKEKNFICNIPRYKLNKVITEDMLYTWQIDIINIIKTTPDDRTIYWYWEANGCKGKTQFCKYLSLHFNAIPLEGKKNDILYCAATFDSDLYVFDIERSLEDYISYAALEKIKNGYYMCAKYESKPIVRDSPHLFCFANFKPDIYKLSNDRWKIIEILND